MAMRIWPFSSRATVSKSSLRAFIPAVAVKPTAASMLKRSAVKLMECMKRGILVEVLVGRKVCGLN